MGYYRCLPGNHVLKRTPGQLRNYNGRAKCGWCGMVVDVVPCPEAAPQPAAKRNPFAPSIMRQRNSGAERLRRQKYRRPA